VRDRPGRRCITCVKWRVDAVSDDQSSSGSFCLLEGTTCLLPRASLQSTGQAENPCPVAPFSLEARSGIVLAG
jgi:hypothetical protein